MRLYLDEEEQAHVYSCLLAGGKVWASMKKGREKLELPTTQEDRELEFNAKLRMQLNPKAEEIARARERKDPAQQDFTAGEGVGGGETGGGHPAGETFKTKLRLNGEDVEPTDENVRDALLKHERLVLMTDIAGWTPEERQSVISWVTEYSNWFNADVKGPEPEEPECLAFVALSNERVEELMEQGPYVISNADDDGRWKVFIPAKGEALEVVWGDFGDDIEAEIKTAKLNQLHQTVSEMSEEDAVRWLYTGPWKVEGRGHKVDIGVEGSHTETDAKSRWFVVHEQQRERAMDQANAKARAARYNRTIAGDGAEPSISLVEAVALEEEEKDAKSTWDDVGGPPEEFAAADSEIDALDSQRDSGSSSEASDDPGEDDE